MIQRCHGDDAMGTAFQHKDARRTVPVSHSGTERNVPLSQSGTGRNVPLSHLVTSFLSVKASRYWRGVMPATLRKTRMKYFSSEKPHRDAILRSEAW